MYIEIYGTRGFLLFIFYMYMSTLNPPKIFLAENELLDDENYIPGLLHHGNIIIQTFAIVSGVLSL